MIKKILSISIILVLVGIIFSCFVGSYLTKSHQVKVGLAPAEFPAINVLFQSESGSLISGWYMEGRKNQGGVLLMHGVKSNRLQMLNRAKFLYKEGYSILLFDFQAHGESLGENVTFGSLESQDAEAAYEFLHSKLNHKSIGVIGVSLGGASALLGTVAKQSKAIILESVYPTIDEAISNRLIMHIGSFGEYLVPLLTLQIEPRLGFNSNKLKPIEHISNITGSVFIIAGEKDRHTALSESKRLFMKAKEPKKMWLVGGAAHLNFDHFRPVEYELKVLEFFKKTL